MAVRVAFGNGWHLWQWFLPSTDPADLPGTSFHENKKAWLPDGTHWGLQGMPAGDPRLGPARDALSSAPADAGGEDGPLFGGRVSHQVAERGREVFDVVGPWNSVKNVSALIDEGGAYAFDGFVHADIDARAAAGDLDLLVRGAKRGNVLSGGGGDRVEVETLIDWPGEHEFRIGTGGGDDEVRLGPLAYSDAVLGSGDPTYGALAGSTGAGWARFHPFAWVFADLGGGDDLFHSPRMASRVEGGDGDDSIVGHVDDPQYAAKGAQYDTIEGGAGDDRVAGSGELRGGDGDDVLTGFGTSTWFAWESSKSPGSGFSTLQGGAGDDTLTGVAGVMDGGPGRDEVWLPGASGDYVVRSWNAEARILTVLDAEHHDPGRDPSYPPEYDHSFYASDVEVVRFEGGGPALVLA